MLLCSLCRAVLSRKRSATATGVRSIGVVERKAPIVEPVFPVDDHADEIDAVGFLHEHLDAVYLEYLIVIFGRIEAQQVAEAGTAAALDANAQAVLFADALLFLNLAQSLHSAFRQAYRCFLSYFYVAHA